MSCQMILLLETHRASMEDMKRTNPQLSIIKVQEKAIQQEEENYKARFGDFPASYLYKNKNSVVSDNTKITQLRTEIQQLKALTNRTAKQQKELQNKMAELNNLEGQSTQQSIKNYLPWIISGFVGGGLITGLVFWLVMRNKNKENKLN